MRNCKILAAVQLSIALLAAGTTLSFAAPIQPNDTGLSKGSVFDIPTPKVYHYPSAPAGESKALPRAYSGTPPQISHDISEHLPITAQNNMCLACHNQPALWGKKLEQGTPTPIPPSHYTDLRNAPGKVTENVVGARYNCNLCHVPQSNATPLVGNTFPEGSAR